MRLENKTIALLACVGLFHLLAIFAGFVSPYGFSQQNRELPYAPPSHLHFRDTNGEAHWRPAVCPLVAQPGTFAAYNEDTEHCSIVRLFVRGEEYTILGLLTSDLHLFGVSHPANVFLLGTDGYGRDVFSRLIYGGQLSLFSGLLATALSLGLGTLLGTIAGYYGGWTDAAIMRCVELFLALPWLYLLFAIRAFMPLHTPAERVFLLLIVLVAVVGWARPARLIRGIVLSAKERHYITAARLFGGSDTYLMYRHILPETYTTVLTQAALLIPQYILAEVTLSFLGLGVPEPVPSWGNMLTTLQQYDVLASYWWMWAPGFALILISTAYLMLANAMQDTCGTASSS
jgi:peptide/nickel transport system permease protein